MTSPAAMPLPADPDVSSNAEPTQLRGKRVAVVVFSHYPSDPRPRRAAEVLARCGMEVEVLCLQQDEREPRRDSFNGVRIRRIPMKRRRGGKFSYVFQYASFLLISFFILALRSLRRRYDLVHVHNMPDALVFSALVPKLRGARVILDLHDPMPELMQTIYGLRPNSFGVRLLNRVEQWSIGFADAVLTVNLACKRLFTERGCRPEKVHVVMNSPDENIFRFRDPAPVASARGGAQPFVIMYHGSLVERHGLDIAVTALGKVKHSIPEAELHVYGQTTPFLEQVLNSVRGSSLESSVRFLGPKKLEQIVEAIDACDLGIIPNRRSIFTEINTPTRIFEYLSRGKPVIAPTAPGIQDYFAAGQLIFFELGDATDLARAIEYTRTHPSDVARIVQLGQGVYAQHKWSSEQMRFLQLVDDLLGGNYLHKRLAVPESAGAKPETAPSRPVFQANETPLPRR
jgi:glycosyltransferase involved in cell wall biosynthesis